MGSFRVLSMSMQVQRLNRTGSAVSAKRCPQCGKAAMLEASLCNACGHQYRTRFVAPVGRTQAFDILLVPPVAARKRRVSPALRTFGLAFVSSFLLVALGGSFLWAVLSLRQPIPVKPQTAALALPAASRAERLYGAIRTSMSLYDVAEAAGGTGRVVRANDPHLLLLAYDYPTQTVHVALSRTDVSSDNYRVQSVELYRGRTLLQRHAE